MNIVDLSQELFDGMPVYPGDPEVEIKQVHTLKNEGWRLRTLALTTHIGTHVNVPSHMVEHGENLDSFELSSFLGKCMVYEKGMDVSDDVGLLFLDENIDAYIADMLIAKKPPFVGLSERHDFDIELEKKLLVCEILSFENLANVEKLPRDKEFDFYAIPLRIRDADGSPVRAFAVLK